MSEMSVEFSFDEQKLQQKGMSKDNVYSMLKHDFKIRKIPCASDGDVLTFAGTGKNEDYGYIWSVIIKYAVDGQVLRSD